VGDEVTGMGVRVDTEGVIRHWPREWEDLAGYTSAEAVGQKVDLIIPPALRARHWQGFNKAIQTGRLKREKRQTRGFTAVAVHKSGKLVALRAALKLTHGDDGTVDGAEGRVLGPAAGWVAPVARAALAVLGLGQRRASRRAS
jgi:PAS domain S-box-containing protein